MQYSQNKKQVLVQIKKRISDAASGTPIWNTDWIDITKYFVTRMSDVSTNLDDSTLQGKLEQNSVSFRMNNRAGLFNPEGTEDSLWDGTNTFLYHTRLRFYEWNTKDYQWDGHEDPTILPLIDGLIAREPSYRQNMNADIQVNSKLDILREHYLLEDIASRVKSASGQSIFYFIEDIMNTYYEELGITTASGILRKPILYNDITPFSSNLLDMLNRVANDGGGIAGLTRDNVLFTTYAGAGLIDKVNLAEHLGWKLEADTLRDGTITSLLRLSTDGKIYGATKGSGALYQYDATNSVWVLVAPELNNQSEVMDILEFPADNKIYGITPNAALFQWNGTNAWVEVAPTPYSAGIGCHLFTNSTQLGIIAQDGSTTLRPKRWDGVSAWVNGTALHPGDLPAADQVAFTGGGQVWITSFYTEASGTYQYQTCTYVGSSLSGGVSMAAHQLASVVGKPTAMTSEPSTKVFIATDIGKLFKWEWGDSATVYPAVSTDAINPEINGTITAINYYVGYIYASTDVGELWRVLESGGAWEQLSGLPAYTGDNGFASFIYEFADRKMYFGTKSAAGQLVSVDSSCIGVWLMDDTDYGGGTGTTIVDHSVVGSNLTVDNTVPDYWRNGFYDWSVNNWYRAAANVIGTISDYTLEMVVESRKNRLTIQDITYGATTFKFHPIFVWTFDSNANLGFANETGTGYQFEGFFLDETGKIRYIAGNTAFTFGYGFYVTVSTNEEIAQGLGEQFLYYLGLTIDSANDYLKCYINGKLVKTIYISGLGNISGSASKQKIVGCGFNQMTKSNGYTTDFTMKMSEIGTLYYHGMKLSDRVKTDAEIFDQYTRLFGSAYSLGG